ncbi:MAG: putative Fe-S cluster assembly protein SufT [Gammaproteobacteria bacterium]|nr:putative Fe-S cluster assembly protein SufT [Gammaproteobacteria bacterium]MCP4091149.1 putative Fe-S cluster assembly protein SufT [Gammaproteobacteria bacterium]MCP4277325.1 putative Fe-S cluster assembly protein SufT [Gammaproteobacteria bacterium]MCP4831614.1 putative Fe-S cluster assembly protein SufT [Gammaproteobacteria bacterium]MCP4927837.1 putative Fe-S cluster assembly protein SufT [Gammaproteobacteria bacterium]
MFSQDSEPVILKRDVQTIVVPEGMEVTLQKDALVYLTQAMGGSFTIYHEGNLFRVAGVDADALGKEPLAPPELPENASDEELEKIVWDQIRTCYDPEIPVNIVDLGLIYQCEVSRNQEDNREVTVYMTLTAPGCGMGEILVEDVREKVSIIPTVEKTEVELTFDPPWNQEMMTEAARLELGLI